MAGTCCLFELRAQGVPLKAGVAFFSEYIGGGRRPSNTGGNRVTKYISHAQTVTCAVLYSPNEKQEYALESGSSASQYFSGQQSSCPANTPAPITHLFALHRVRQLKRMVSTIITFVWWPQTCLQLVLRPPPPLSDGHCCICFSTQTYRVSQKLTEVWPLPFKIHFSAGRLNISPWILQ